MKSLTHQARSASIVSWASFLTVLLLFVAATFVFPPSESGRARHRAEAAQRQAAQIAKGAKGTPILARPEWREAPMARSLKQWDHRVFRAINYNWNNPVFDRVMPLATYLGDGLVQAFLLLALFTWAMFRRREAWRRTALMGFAGVVLGIAAPLLKLILPRFRPPALYPYDVVLLVHPLYGGSFPSGHTLTSFCIATILARRHRWTAPWAFGLATLVGLSRISVGVHWPLDVLGGAVLGIASGWLVPSLWAFRMRAAVSAPASQIPAEQGSSVQAA